MTAWNGHVVRPYSHTPRDINKCVMPPLRGRKGLVEILFPAVIVPNLCFVQLSAWDCGVLLCDSWIGVDEYLLQCILILAGSMNNTLEAKRLFSIVLKYSRSTKNASDTKTYVGRSLFAAQGWSCGQFKNSPGDRSKQMVCLKVNSSHALQAVDEIISKSSVEPACLPESIAGSPTWKISVLGQIFLQCRDLKALEKMRLKKCRIWKKSVCAWSGAPKLPKTLQSGHHWPQQFDRPLVLSSASPGTEWTRAIAPAALLLGDRGTLLKEAICPSSLTWDTCQILQRYERWWLYNRCLMVYRCL